MSQFSYTQLPPDGTGKKLVAKETVELKYENSAGLFPVGEIVTTDSGLVGTVALDIPAKDEVYINLSTDFDTATLVIGEPIRLRGVINAYLVSMLEDIYTPAVTLVSGDNSINAIRINNKGSLVSTFATGDPLFDAFGKLGVAESTMIREYQPTGVSAYGNFSNENLNGGASSFNHEKRSYDMTTGVLAGALARKRSHLYHKYQVGVATTALFSLSMDAHDKPNVHKRMGIFDDYDGLYFHSDGVGDMGVVLRSSVSGAVVNTHIHQHEWNTDRMDGLGGIHNLSNVNLDPTKTQVYFIDFQWLGAGRVRFGFFVDGVPIVVHQIMNANNEPFPYMRTGTLPLTFEVENMGVPSSSNRLSLIASAVRCEGKFEPREKLFGGTWPTTFTIDDPINFKPLLSFRAKAIIGGTYENRTVTLGKYINVAETSATGKPWVIEVVKADTLDGVPYATTGDMGIFSDNFPLSAVEINSTALTSTGGEVILSKIVSGVSEIDLSDFFNMAGEIVMRRAKISDNPIHYTIRARTFDATALTFGLAFAWKEIR